MEGHIAEFSKLGGQDSNVFILIWSRNRLFQLFDIAVISKKWVIIPMRNKEKLNQAFDVVNNMIGLRYSIEGAIIAKTQYICFIIMKRARWAQVKALAGRMRPAGPTLETPGFNKRQYPTNQLQQISCL